MAEVLASAEPVAPKRGNSKSEARDHNTLDWASTPHKGKTSPEEARLVRENLEAVNAELIAKGSGQSIREIRSTYAGTGLIRSFQPAVTN